MPLQVQEATSSGCKACHLILQCSPPDNDVDLDSVEATDCVLDGCLCITFDSMKELTGKYVQKCPGMSHIHQNF